MISRKANIFWCAVKNIPKYVLLRPSKGLPREGSLPLVSRLQGRGRTFSALAALEFNTEHILHQIKEVTTVRVCNG
jgi:hypothetical protein